MPGLILIRPAVWPQYTNVTDRQDRKDRQRSDSIGRTVLQTVAQKMSASPRRWLNYHFIAGAKNGSSVAKMRSNSSSENMDGSKCDRRPYDLAPPPAAPRSSSINNRGQKSYLSTDSDETL